jgi:hypothetical protein
LENAPEFRKASLSYISSLYHITELGLKEHKHRSKAVYRHYYLRKRLELSASVTNKGWFESCKEKFNNGWAIYQALDGVREDRGEISCRVFTRS